jgi:hypothetical protein
MRGIFCCSTALLLHCSTALLICCSIGMGHGLWAAFVFVAATFTVAKIRRLKTCDYILHGFTLHAFTVFFTLHGFTLHAKKFPLPLFKKEGFLLCVIVLIIPLCKGGTSRGICFLFLVYIYYRFKFNFHLVALASWGNTRTNNGYG